MGIEYLQAAHEHQENAKRIQPMQNSGRYRVTLNDRWDRHALIYTLVPWGNPALLTAVFEVAVLRYERFFAYERGGRANGTEAVATIVIKAPSVVGRRGMRDLVCGEQEIWLLLECTRVCVSAPHEHPPSKSRGVNPLAT
jgi:hypothetical protein